MCRQRDSAAKQVGLVLIIGSFFLNRTANALIQDKVGNLFHYRSAVIV